MARNGKTLLGQQFNPSDAANTVIPYSQRMMDDASAALLVGQAATEINPIDAQNSEVKVYDVTAIQAILDAEVLSFPAKTFLDLPDELTGITITFNKNEGEGVSSHPSSQMDWLYAFVGTGSATAQYNPRASAQGSASIVPGVQPIRKYYGRVKVNSTRYFFYMAENYTNAQLLTRLGTITGLTVLDLPVFHPESIVLNLSGQSVSLNQSAESRSSITIGAREDGGIIRFARETEYGSGYSEEGGVTMNMLEIPPTLHAGLTLSGYSSTATAVVDVEASTPQMSSADAALFTPAISNNPVARTKNATGLVYPVSIPATVPTAIPKSGLYLVDVDNSPNPWDRLRVFAEIVNFNIFA